MSYYVTGSAADVNDLLDEVRNALTAHCGYAQQHHDLLGLGGGYRTHLSKGNLRVNLASCYNGAVPVVASERNPALGTFSWNAYGFAPDSLSLNLSTGFNFSSSWVNQPGAPGQEISKGMAVMLNCKGVVSRYWLIQHDSPEAVFLFVEVAPNKFNHLAWGNLTLFQQIESGGEWFTGSRPVSDTYGKVHEALSGVSSSSDSNRMTGYFRVSDSRLTGTANEGANSLNGWGASFIDNGTPEHSSGGMNTSFGTISSFPQYNGPYRGYGYGPFQNALTESWIEKEQRSVVMPINCWKYINGGYSLIGQIPHAGRTSMQAYLAGDQLAGMGETWLAFPGHTRRVPFSEEVYWEYSNPRYPPNDVGGHFGIGVAVRRP